MRGSSTELFLPKPKIEYLKKGLVMEGQNCGTAFQMKQETNILLLHLIHVYDNWPINILRQLRILHSTNNNLMCK
jgi:hypothetical protein